MHSSELDSLKSHEFGCKELYDALDWFVDLGIITEKEDHDLAIRLNRLANQIALFHKNEEDKKKILYALQEFPLEVK